MKKIPVFVYVFAAYLLGILLFFTDAIWWDSAVYIGMAKYIWSSGSLGLWESARPVFLPFIVGGFWKIGLNPYLAGIFFVASTGLLSVYILYKILTKEISKRTAIIITLMFSLNLYLVKYSSKLLAEVPAMTFSLLGFYFLIYKKNFLLPGFFLGLAILTKFTHIIFIPIFLFYILSEKNMQFKNIFAGRFLRSILKFSFTLLITVSPFLFFNFLAYGNILYSFLQGNALINDVVMNYGSPTSLLFYIKKLITGNHFLLLAFVPFFLMFKDKNRKKMTLFLAFFLPLVYHSLFLNYKSMRYSTIFLPYLFILAAFGLEYLFQRSTKKFVYSLLILASIQIYFLADQVYVNSVGGELDPYSRFYDYDLSSINGKIWSSNPHAIIDRDIKISELVYFPVFSSKKAEYLLDKLDNDPQYIFMSNCDIPCIRDDPHCPTKKHEFLKKINNTYEVELSYNVSDCNYRVYRWKR